MKHRLLSCRLRDFGFTLVELLIVLSLVALLLSIAVPRYMGSLQRSKEQVLVENLRGLRMGIDKFHADTGRYPATLAALSAARYFHSVPVDPITESTSTWQVIPATDENDHGIRDVKSGAVGQTREGVPYEEL
jgi:general secretion pathway protein G